MALVNDTLRGRGFVLGLHALLWVLLVLAVVGIGGRAPEFSEAVVRPAAPSTPVPVARLEKLFTTGNSAQIGFDAAKFNLFATSHFTPPPAPPPPPPPPPTTRKVELTYQGFYRTGDGPKFAMLHLDGKTLSIPVGGRVVTNLYVVDATMKTLTLTNSAVQTNVLNLSVRQVLEVPLK